MRQKVEFDITKSGGERLYIDGFVISNGELLVSIRMEAYNGFCITDPHTMHYEFIVNTGDIDKALPVSFSIISSTDEHYEITNKAANTIEVKTVKPDDESVKQLNTKIGRCGLHYEEVETEEIRLRKRLDERARAYNDLYDKEQALKKKLSYTKLAFAGTTFALSVGFFAVRYLTMAQQPSTSADFNPSCRPCGGLGGD